VSLEQVYRYRRQSRVDTSGGVDLRLATSGGPVEHPYFFDGFVERAEVVAAALLVVARVARTRFYTPPTMLAAILLAADPIVTSDGARLRFESFSACCGVYCRLDLLPAGLDRAPRATGTTNVDFNAPIRDALAGIGGLDPMHLAVGADELLVTTLDTSVVERRVPLPQRWVRSLAESHVIAQGMRPAADYTGVQVRRFLQAQPSGTQRGVLFAVPGRSGPRLATRLAPGGVGVAGLERLRVIEPLLRHTSSVRTFGLDTGSAWLLQLPDARLTVMLSPSPSRAFSGEGGLLDDIALAAAGRAGFDLADGTSFERQLPLDSLVLQADQPRMRDAIALADTGSVTLRADRAVVHSRDTDYVVRQASDGERCTCTWFAKHGLSRGPCKHILAVRLTRGRGAANDETG
jgi:hypothetical protein